jgi:hypothetical protein
VKRSRGSIGLTEYNIAELILEDVSEAVPNHKMAIYDQDREHEGVRLNALIDLNSVRNRLY